MVTIGSGPLVIWIIARQHPGEPMAEWCSEGAFWRCLRRCVCSHAVSVAVPVTASMSVSMSVFYLRVPLVYLSYSVHLS
jgi:hypothetical protein